MLIKASTGRTNEKYKSKSKIVNFV